MPHKGWTAHRNKEMTGRTCARPQVRAMVSGKRSKYMNNKQIQSIFEQFFEKYKKTEGDRSAWSAVWAETAPDGILELNMTQCPRGTVFKIFVDKRKQAELIGWDAFFEYFPKLQTESPELFNPQKIFSDMQSML